MWKWNLIYSNFLMSTRIIPFLLLKGIELLGDTVQVNFSTSDLFIQCQLAVVLNLQGTKQLLEQYHKGKNLLLSALRLLLTLYICSKNSHFSMFRIAFLIWFLSKK